jgi:hypothetical protein
MVAGGLGFMSESPVFLALKAVLQSPRCVSDLIHQVCYTFGAITPEGSPTKSIPFACRLFVRGVDWLSEVWIGVASLDGSGAEPGLGPPRL